MSSRVTILQIPHVADQNTSLSYLLSYWGHFYPCNTLFVPPGSEPSRFYGYANPSAHHDRHASTEAYRPSFQRDVHSEKELVADNVTNVPQDAHVGAAVVLAGLSGSNAKDNAQGFIECEVVQGSHHGVRADREGSLTPSVDPDACTSSPEYSESDVVTVGHMSSGKMSVAPEIVTTTVTSQDADIGGTHRSSQNHRKRKAKQESDDRMWRRKRDDRLLAPLSLAWRWNGQGRLDVAKSWVQRQLCKQEKLTQENSLKRIRMFTIDEPDGEKQRHFQGTWMNSAYPTQTCKYVSAILSPGVHKSGHGERLYVHDIRFHDLVDDLPPLTENADVQQMQSVVMNTHGEAYGRLSLGEVYEGIDAVTKLCPGYQDVLDELKKAPDDQRLTDKEFQRTLKCFPLFVSNIDRVTLDRLGHGDAFSVCNKKDGMPPWLSAEEVQKVTSIRGELAFNVHKRAHCYA